MQRNPFALTRRQVLKLAGTLSLALPLRRLAAQPPRVNNQGVARPFLNLREYRDLDAMTARIIPTDDLPGAREARVVDYIQGMLSTLPAADANCDRGRSAADFTAVVLQLDGPVDPACSGADVNFDGTITASDPPSARQLLSRPSSRAIFADQPFGDFNSSQATDNTTLTPSTTSTSPRTAFVWTVASTVPRRPKSPTIRWRSSCPTSICAPNTGKA
jgi:hypothetical protein